VAETFFYNKIDVLVNNAGVSPKLGFDICMKINLDGVLNGVTIFEEKLSRQNGGAGGLIINTASCAGLTRPTRHDTISYFLSKNAVVNITQDFGSSRSVYKTGIKHVALCPWFVETAIVDEQTKKLVLEKSPLKFTTVGRVGEAFELAVKEQRTGGAITVLPNTPLVYYPDLMNFQGLILYFLSKFVQLFGVEVVTPEAQGGALTLEQAIAKQLKASLLADGLSRGLREVVKAIESGKAIICFLAEDCGSKEYVQLIEGLCASRSVDLLKVPSRKSLGLWAGLGKTDEEGQVVKNVACSSCTINDWGKTQSEAKNMIQNHLQ